MWRTGVKSSTKRLINQFERQKSSCNDYQYLQRSQIPTMHFQPSLPRLPIPKLEKTCERYLAAQRPLLIEEAFRKTEANVQRFRDTVGRKLQEILVREDKGNKDTSYITGHWFDKYLTDRSPLPLNVNPMLVFQNDERAEYQDQSIRTSNMIISSLRFYKSLKGNVLEPEVFHLNPKKSDTDRFRTVCSVVPSKVSWYAAFMHNAYPLDMSQYHNLFNTTRIPEIDKDRIFSEKAGHIVVQYKGNFYKIDVLDESDTVIEPKKILSSIKSILKTTDVAKFPVGILTTMERNKWGTVRHNLAALGNEKVLRLIDTALFNVCLDDVIVDNDKYKVIRNYLHGDGKNRWFDKSLSLILTKDGCAGVNFEHSWGDGVAVLRYFQDIYKDTLNNPFVNADTEYTDVPVERLDFVLDDSVKAAIQDAERDYNKLCTSLDVNFVESEGLGKKFCKKYDLSPDAVMQLCFQSAYHKQFGKFVPTYESCSTAAFKHGRTETIRPCTLATKKFSLAVNSTKKPSNSDLVGLIKDCSKVHGQLTKEAAMGQGFDRHLFALQLLSNKQEPSHENIFEDPSYLQIHHNILSTSTLSSPAVLAGGFGPVVRDGLGIAYVIRDNSMGTLATTYPDVDGAEFISCLKDSIQEVVTILSKSK